MAKLTDDILRWTLEINGNPAMKTLTDLEQMTYKLRKANEQLRLELLKLEAAGKKNTEEYRNLQAQFKSNDATINQNRAQMSLLRNEIGINSLTARQLRDELKRLKLQIDNTTPNTPAWKALHNQFDAVKNKLGEVSVGMGKSNALFGAFKSLIPGLGIAGVATGLFQLGKEIFNTVMHIELFDRKVKLTFGETLPMMKVAAADNAKQMELTKREYMETAASTANFMLQLGFSREKAASLSIQVLNLAGALKEWNGDVMEAGQVNEILTKGILGQTRGLKEVGITVDQTSKEFKKSVETLMEHEKVTREQAEALTMLAQIQERSKLAQAAYAQDVDMLKNKVEGVTTWWKQLKETVAGWFLIPTVDKIKNERDELNILVSSIMSVNDNQTFRNSLIKELQLKYPDFLKNLDTETLTNEQLKQALEGVNFQYDQKIKLAYNEEKITENLKEGVALLEAQQNSVELINKVYLDNIENADAALTVEEKIKVLREKSSVLQYLQDRGKTYWDEIKYAVATYEQSQVRINENTAKDIELQKDKVNILSEAETKKLEEEDFYEAKKLGIIQGEMKVRELTTEEAAKLTELRRQLAEKEKQEYSPDFYEAQKLGIIKGGGGGSEIDPG